MIKIIGVQKADKDKPPHFELVFIDLEKQQNQKGYFQTTKYGTEAELRKLLKSSGMSDADINKHFERA